MRTTTGGELAVLAANERQITYRVKVENGSGTMIDLSSWVDHISWALDIDQPVSDATVYFVRANGSTQSLSPLRNDSTLNLKDDLVTISAQLDPGRKLTIEVATTAIGAAIAGGDYKLLFDGVIDVVNFEDNPVSAICRDQGGLLVDRWVGANWSLYQAFALYGRVAGSGTVSAAFGAATFSVSQAGAIANGDTITVGSNTYTISAFSGTTTATLSPGLATFAPSAFTINHRSLQNVMQDILTDAINAGPVPIAVTLNTPVSPSFEITKYRQQNMSVMDAEQALAGVIGWDARYKFDSGSGTFKFTLSQPDRTKTVPDYTFGPSAYFKVTRLNIDRTKVRNFIDLIYTDEATKATHAYRASDTASQTRYGFQYMKIEEPIDSPINSLTEATRKGDAVLSDLKDPKAEQEIELPFFWPAELGDLYRHSANSVHYSGNQDYAVVRIEHELGPGYHRTKLKTRGKPAGAHVNWFPPPTPHPVSYVPRIISPTGVNLMDAETGTSSANIIDPTTGGRILNPNVSALSKTIRLGAADFDTTLYSYEKQFTAGEVVVAAATNITVNAAMRLPAGVTLVGWRWRTYLGDTNGLISVSLIRAVDGTATTIDTDSRSASASGYSTRGTRTISEVVDPINNFYYVTALLQRNTVPVSTNLRLSWVEIDYVASDLAQTI